jgi:hypothetical protein
MIKNVGHDAFWMNMTTPIYGYVPAISDIALKIDLFLALAGKLETSRANSHMIFWINFCFLYSKEPYQALSSDRKSIAIFRAERCLYTNNSLSESRNWVDS